MSFKCLNIEGVNKRLENQFLFRDFCSQSLTSNSNPINLPGMASLNNSLCFEDNETMIDPLYGLIKISAFEKRMINTPEFQRLRGIKQLGFVNLVYHTAEHTRFVHSIGVCYQAKKLVDQINHNLKREARYRQWRKEGKNINSPLFEENYGDSLITISERIVISAAALLHDLPHAPFSHEIESQDGDTKKGIPYHDDFATNPAMFNYLFDTENSKLAKIVKIYSQPFWELLKKENSQWSSSFLEGKLQKIVDENGIVDIDSFGIKPIIKSKDCKIEKLSLLGILMFEIHLFDKPSQWIYQEKIQGKLTFKDNLNRQKVITSWESPDKEYLEWHPMYGWFRPYRKDIVGNTICADLIDYIQRDGRHTGIISTLDFKFLDRMTITRAVVSEKDEPTDLRVDWNDIKDTCCEHIVFDVFDHKRGFIRESIITEILSCLHGRYQLAERAYNHRVVEGARSMLQEISRQLCIANLLTVEKLHDCNAEVTDKPLEDETFLKWVLHLKDQKDYKLSNSKEKIDIAISLVQALKERKIYREALIIDGFNGFISGTFAGADYNCKALADYLIERSEGLENILTQINDLLKENYRKNNNGGLSLPSKLVTIGVRKFGKRYKPPRVLVAKPFAARGFRKEEYRLEIQPLFVCQYPPHIKNQLEALKTAYNSLWRVFLFIHPAFHSETFNEVHKNVVKIFLDHLSKETKITWRNSVDLEQLLSKEPIDVDEFIFYARNESITTKIIEYPQELKQLREFCSDIIFNHQDRIEEEIKKLSTSSIVEGKDKMPEIFAPLKVIFRSEKRKKICSDPKHQKSLLQIFSNENFNNIWNKFDDVKVAAQEDRKNIMEYYLKEINNQILDLRDHEQAAIFKDDNEL